MKLTFGKTIYEWTEHGWQRVDAGQTLVSDVRLMLDEVVRLREEVARLRAELGLDSVE